MISIFAQADGEPGGLALLLSNPLIPLIIVGFLFYMMLWRPERKRRSEHQVMLNNLKGNDRVVTVGGIHGTIVNAQQGADYVTVRIDESSNTRVRISRSCISRVVTDDSEAKSKES